MEPGLSAGLAGRQRGTAQPVTHLAAELRDALQGRFVGVPEDEFAALVESALRDLGEVTVTGFLPILVERRLRTDLSTAGG